MTSEPSRSAFSSRQFRVLSAVAFFMIAISWSPLLRNLLFLNASLTFLMAFLIFIAISLRFNGINIRVFLLSAILLTMSAALLTLTQSITLWIRTVPLGLLIFAAYQIVSIKGLPESICKLLTIWLTGGILLSIAGFVYAFLGGEPLLTITNPDGRDNSLYLSTMSNAQFGNVIRPAWIYDEPGAFSFLICATVAMRLLLNASDRISIFLLIGGLVTFSLTHILITFIFLIARLGIFRVSIVGILIAVLTPMMLTDIDEFRFVVDRFSIEDGRLAGDNRSNQIENFLRIANWRIALVGDVECHELPDRVCSEHGDISSSPVTPVYSGGLLFLVTQISVHFMLLIAFFKNRRFRLPAAILTILLLQRPYFAGYGYGLMTYISLFLMFNTNRLRIAPFRRKAGILGADART